MHGTERQPKDRAMRAVIYERISDDPDGEEENIGIRLDEDREYVADQGWVLVGEFPDDDIPASKYTKKPRPQYNAMITAIKSGAVDVIVTTEMERLYRRMEELLDLIKLAEVTPLRKIAITDGGGYDLSTGEGIYNAIQAVNRAMHEARKISDRTKRKKARTARNGWWGGGKRRFGYQLEVEHYTDAKGRPKTRYRLVPDPDEAKLINNAIDRILAGESAYGIARDWMKAGVSGALGGKQLDVSTVKRMLTSAHLAGKRVHHGELYDGNWPAIVDPERWEQARRILKREPNGNAVPRTRTYLLPGLLYCWCGSRVYAHGRNGKAGYAAGYECKKMRGGCGRTRRKAEPIDEAVRDAALEALASPEFRSKLERKVNERHSNDGKVAELLRQKAQDKAQLARLRDSLTDGEIEPADFKHAKNRIAERLEGIERQLDSISTPDSNLLDSLPTDYDGLLKAWNDDWTLDRQRAVLRLAVERVILKRFQIGGWRVFDAEAELLPIFRV